MVRNNNKKNRGLEAWQLQGIEKPNKLHLLQGLISSLRESITAQLKFKMFPPQTSNPMVLSGFSWSLRNLFKKIPSRQKNEFYNPVITGAVMKYQQMLTY